MDVKLEYVAESKHMVDNTLLDRTKIGREAADREIMKGVRPINGNIEVRLNTTGIVRRSEMEAKEKYWM